MTMTVSQAEVELIAACTTCEGDGWIVGIGVEVETRCCGGSDWECGASGCTGPRQEQVQVQIQEPCPDCDGTGHLKGAS